MTFLEIQTAVLERFTDSTSATNCKQWINSVYGMIWTLEPWTFKQGEDDVSVSVGSVTVGSLAPDLGVVKGVWNAEGDPLVPLSPRAWNHVYRYMEIQGQTGKPEAYKVVNGVVSVGPPSNEAKTNYRMLYQKKLTDLSANGDIPAIPDEFHWSTLVAGAMAIGQGHFQDPSSALLDPIVARAIEAMRRDFLEDVKVPGSRQWGAYS